MDIEPTLLFDIDIEWTKSYVFVPLLRVCCMLYGTLSHVCGRTFGKPDERTLLRLRMRLIIRSTSSWLLVGATVVLQIADPTVSGTSQIAEPCFGMTLFWREL